MEFTAANNFIVTLIVIMVGLVIGILWIDHKRQSARMQYEQRIEGLEREHDKLVATREAEQEGRKAEIQQQMKQLAEVDKAGRRVYGLLRKIAGLYPDDPHDGLVDYAQVGNPDLLSSGWRKRLFPELDLSGKDDLC